LSPGILVFGFLASILAVQWGHIARQDTRQSGGTLRGNVLVTAGLTTGYFGIATIMGTLIPSRSISKTYARRAQAETDVMQIAAAMKQYYTEYGKYPIAYEAQNKSSRDLTVGLTKHNSVIFNTLRSLPEGMNRENRLNPRKIVFFEGRVVPDPAKPRGGFADQDLFPGELKGSYFDPWGHEYLIRIHYDDKNPTVTPTGEITPEHVLVWSAGEDGLQGTADDIVSWK